LSHTQTAETHLEKPGPKELAVDPPTLSGRVADLYVLLNDVRGLSGRRPEVLPRPVIENPSDALDDLRFRFKEFALGLESSYRDNVTLRRELENSATDDDETESC
jgi:hypothetical protein